MDTSVRTDRLSRRNTLRAVGGILTVSLVTGCSSDSGGGNGNGGDDTTTSPGVAATVAAGPDGQFVFDPESVTVSTGETVRWVFESVGHNVAAWPDMSEEISIPDGAEGFGTMPEGGDAYETLERGETYEHTFETPGEYVYVCMPHVVQNMIGTVVVEG